MSELITAGLVLGGPEAQARFKKGQFGGSIEWINGEESLCIWPLRAQLGAGAFVIGLRSIHQYFDEPFEKGRPSRYGMLSCMKALDVMKIGATDRGALIQLLDLLYEWAPDLVRAKPDTRPDPMPAGIEAAELVIDGQVVSRITH